MTSFNYSNYKPCQPEVWSGRKDGVDRASKRWHQVVELIDLRVETNFINKVVLLGFCCDEGVRRNLGRIGAKEAPGVFRQVLGNLPIHFHENIVLKDAGDICCDDGDLEQAQYVLSEAVASIIRGGGFPIVLGGGHEVTYGNYQGLKTQSGKRKIGIINLDAHLDIRPVIDGKGNSGTGFYQIAEDCQSKNEEFHYLAIGIQKISNTKSLFEYADQKNVHVIFAEEIHQENLKRIITIIEKFSRDVESIYLTIDMDVFAAPYAPGVSALAYNGLIPDQTFFSILSKLFALPNLRILDIAELNPLYDIDNRTARLGSTLLFEMINKL